MIYVKKLMAACAAIALAATSMLPMAASAAANTEGSITLALSVNDTVANPAKEEYEVDDTVIINLNVTEVTGPGVNSWHVLVGYDADSFELTEIKPGKYGSKTYAQKNGEDGESYDGATEKVQASLVTDNLNPFDVHWTFANATNESVMLSYADKEAPGGPSVPKNTAFNFTDTGKVASFTFKVKEGASAGSHNFTLNFVEENGQPKLPFRTFGTSTNPGDDIGDTIKLDGTVLGTTVKVKSNVVELTDFSIAPTAQTVGVGRTFKIQPNFTPGNATDKNVTYVSADPNTASVAADGTVTGVKKGTTTITATCGGFSKECAVTVENIPITSLEIADVTVEKTSSVTVTPTIAPPDATNKDLTWVIGDETIATVDANGKVTGKKVGETTLTVSTNDESNLSKQVKVTVTPLYAKTVTTNVTEVTLKTVGTSYALESTVLPAATDFPTVTYKSNDESIATVNSDGVITAQGEGDCTISVSVKTGPADTDVYTQTVAVHVPKAVDYDGAVVTSDSSAELTILNGESKTPDLNLREGETVTFQLQTDGATSDSYIEFDASTGRVKGARKGSGAKIVATVHSNVPGTADRTYTYEVNVQDDFKVEFNPAVYNIKVGENANLGLKITTTSTDADYKAYLLENFGDLSTWEVKVKDDGADYVGLSNNKTALGKKTGNAVIVATNRNYCDDNGQPIEISCTVNVSTALPPIETPNYHPKSDPYTGPREAVSNQVNVRVTDSSSSSSGSPIAATGGEFDTDSNNAAAIAAGVLGVIALGFVVVARKKRRS